MSQTSHNEWVVDSSFTHHMVKDASLFSFLDIASENKVYVANDFVFYIIGHGDIAYRHGWIVNVYHVPSLGANLLLVSQST